MNSRHRNIKLTLAYDGTHYSGWQSQKEQVTIQATLEKAITKMTGSPVHLQGAGRTDSGVHSLGMAANFKTSANISCTGFLKGLNSILPRDIRVIAVDEETFDFHARKMAKSKTYIYNISNSPVQIPTDRLYSAHVAGKLQISAIKKCLELLQGIHDFSSFEAAGSRDPDQAGRGATREIFSARITHVKKDNTIRIIITGDGFLRHMVRNIAGTLIEVGKGRITVDDFKKILAAHNRSLAGPTAPAHGLFLKEVCYNP